MTNPMIEAAARAIAKEKGIEICSDAMYQFSTFGPLAQAAITAIEPMIRADERAQAEREIVEWLRNGAIKAWGADCTGESETAFYARAIEAGEYKK